MVVDSANASSFYTQEHLHTLPNATPSHLWVLLVTRPVSICLRLRPSSLVHSVFVGTFDIVESLGVHSPQRNQIFQPNTAYIPDSTITHSEDPNPAGLGVPDGLMDESKAYRSHYRTYVGTEHLVLSAIVWSVLLGVYT